MPDNFPKSNNQTEENIPPAPGTETIMPEELPEEEMAPIENPETKEPPQPISPPPKMDPYKEMPSEDEYQPKG